MKLDRRSLLGAGAALALSPRWVEAATPVDVRVKGQLSVAVYKNFAPFYDDDSGKGIDVDIGRALAKALRLKASALPFPADESVDDDLRNMVWKGHYLGYGPADVMMHVPVAKSLMDENEQVMIFAPYYRETLQIARRLSDIPKLGDASHLQGRLVGTEDASLGSAVLLGAAGGRLRDSVRHFKSTGQAVKALLEGKLAGVVAQRSELQSAMVGAKGYEISDLPARGAPPKGWVLGLAVKKSNDGLGQALAAAMKELIRIGEIKKIFAAYNVDWLRP